METSWVDLTVTGERMPAYVARPDGKPNGGVIVIQEIFGVDAGIRRITDLLASIGYLAVAPAVFHRTDPDFQAAHDPAGFERGRAAGTPLEVTQIVADVTAAAAYLRDQLGADAGIATWGFCFGGSVAYLSATLPFVKAAVSFYGGQIAKAAAAHRPPLVALTAEVQAPLFLAFGGLDPYISRADIELVRQALEEHNKIFDLRVYAQEDHGFFRDGPDANEGAREVWPRVQAFLATHLAAS